MHLFTEFKIKLKQVAIFLNIKKKAPIFHVTPWLYLNTDTNCEMPGNTSNDQTKHTENQGKPNNPNEDLSPSRQPFSLSTIPFLFLNHLALRPPFLAGTLPVPFPPPRGNVEGPRHSARRGRPGVVAEGVVRGRVHGAVARRRGVHCRGLVAVVRVPRGTLHVVHGAFRRRRRVHAGDIGVGLRVHHGGELKKNDPDEIPAARWEI